jgi:hypothetical protein
MKGFPIVFLHNKKSNFLLPAIYQAKRSNPTSPIYIISSVDAKSFYQPHANFINIDDFFNEARDFEKIYKHLNSNSYAFELICIQRWYVLNEFMKKMQFDKILVLDSDCLLYLDVSTDWNRLEGYDFGLINILCPAVTYICSQSSLQKFCNYVNEEYTVNLENTVNSYKERFIDTGNIGGICDMTHFSTFHTKFNTIYDLSRIENDTTYDISIRDSINTNAIDITPEEAAGYKMNSKNGFKSIYWEKGIPYCKLNATNRAIQFKSLHFQGIAKVEMPYYYQGELSLKLKFIKNNLSERFAAFRKDIFKK